MPRRERSHGRLAGLMLACGVAFAAPAGAGFCPDEQARARASALKVNEEWPQRPASDPVARYLQALVERLGRTTPQGAGLAWRVTTLRDHAPFAFSIGYGYLYVTDGALAFARSESEIAAILAHEIGHQLAGHFCRPTDSAGASGLVIGSLRQVIDLEKEQEADRFAVRILQAARLDPAAMLAVAERLPESTAAGHAQRNARRLGALRTFLATQQRPVPVPPVAPPTAAFLQAKELVEAR